jgi:anti-sigma regulatory factor (Ser/Thr protein kinase)
VSATRTVDIELAAAADSVAQARASLDQLAGVVKEDLFDDLRLLVSEVVTNSVRHAGLRPSDSVAVHVTVAPGRVRAEVVDPGPGFEPPARGPSAGASSGWGLFLVDRVADRWGVDRTDGHTRVWFEIDR